MSNRQVPASLVGQQVVAMIDEQGDVGLALYPGTDEVDWEDLRTLFAALADVDEGDTSIDRDK